MNASISDLRRERVALMLRRRLMSDAPKFRSAADIMRKLQHNLDYDTEKLAAKAAEIDEKREAVFRRSHATLAGHDKQLDEMNKHLEYLDQSNSNSSEDAPRSSDLTARG